MATCRITILPLNFQELQAEYPAKKMLKMYERNHYVYENKQNLDKIPGEKSDIYVDMTRFLEIIELLGRNLPPPCALSRILVHNTARPRRRGGIAGHHPHMTMRAVGDHGQWRADAGETKGAQV